MPSTLGVHVSIDGPGDGLVSAPHLVQVDHRCLLAVMPYASHEILDARRAAVAIIESLPGLGPVLA